MLVRPNGIGELLGDVLITGKPFQSTGDVWFVNSNGGQDGAAPAGKDREKPLASLAQAITSAAAGDIIVLMTNHTETLTGPLSVNKAVVIVGAGLSGGLPTVTLKINSAANDLLDVSAAAAELHNILFPASVQSNVGGGGGSKIFVNAAQFRCVGCYFQCSGNDQMSALGLGTGANNARIVNTTFISTATAVATRPRGGLEITAAISDLEMDGVTFSDGTVGFAQSAMLATAAAITRLRGQNISQLLGADIQLHASTVGWLNIQTATGGGRLSW